MLHVVDVTTFVFFCMYALQPLLVPFPSATACFFVAEATSKSVPSLAAYPIAAVWMRSPSQKNQTQHVVSRSGPAPTFPSLIRFSTSLPPDALIPERIWIGRRAPPHRGPPHAGSRARLLSSPPSLPTALSSFARQEPTPASFLHQEPASSVPRHCVRKKTEAKNY
jgi:hypothetical protein